MTLYLIVDDCPEEFGPFQVFGIYRDKKKAKKRLEVLKKKDRFRYQYTDVWSRRTVD